FTTVAPYFDEKRGLTKLGLLFADELGEEETRKRETLARALEGALGPPVERGQCHQIWRATDAEIILERGSVTLVGIGAGRPNIDVFCTRLVPLKPFKKKDSETH